uniref:Rho-GAP domain-containing protein n=2 Tax=Plectus sambesii TaxID=2011161 RepID=A0A914V1B3_9BILA
MNGEDGGGGGRDPSSLERGRKGRRDKKDKGYTQLDRASSEEDLLVGDSQAARAKKGVFGKKKEKEKAKDKRAVQPSSPSGKQRKDKPSHGKGGGAPATTRPTTTTWQSLVQTRPVFGVPLADAVSNNRSHDGVPLPAVIRQCLDFVTEHGLDMEGVYRVSAPKARLDELERRADAGLWLEFLDAHEAAGLLKRFLRQLPNHILTERLRDGFEKAATECPCPMNGCCTCLTGDRLKAYLRQLPACNYALVAYLFRHAQLIVSNEHANKMSLAALGLVLQATLNMSQALLRIFLMNASSEHAKNLPHNKAATFLFDDVEIKRYVNNFLSYFRTD